MPLDYATFVRASPDRVEPPTNPKVKWPVKGYTILSATAESDEVGDFITLQITGADGASQYVLRPGDEAGLPFAEELYREVDEGLIEITGD